PREPERVRPPQPERLDETREHVRVIGKPERRRRIVGTSASGRVPRDDGELVREPIELGLPVAAVPQPTVEQDEGRTAPSPLVRDPEPSDLDLHEPPPRNPDLTSRRPRARAPRR